MPWYIEKDTGQERRRKAQGVCFTPHYGEDEAAANRAARKRTKNDPHGDTFVAVYLIPLDEKEEKLLLQEERRRGSGAARMLMTMAAGLASGLNTPVVTRGARRSAPSSPDLGELEEEHPPFGEFLRNMGDAQKIDNGDGTITLVDGNGTPRLVVGKNIHDQIVAIDLESDRSTVRVAELLRQQEGHAVVPRIECGHPTPDGPCCRLQGHVSKTHWARMPVTPEDPVDTGARVEREAERAAHTGSTTEVTNKASSTLVVGDLAFFEPKAYFDIHSSCPEAMLRPVDPRFRLKGLGKKKP